MPEPRDELAALLRAALGECYGYSTVHDDFGDYDHALTVADALLVARKHGRRCIGIDLSADYLEIAKRRTQQLSLLGGAA